MKKKPIVNKVKRADRKFNHEAFRERNANKLLVVPAVLFFLFLISLFKNISYPLLWADESMTVIGSERVLEYGYPKVHDGKNVFYDLKHSNAKLGIREDNDAYVGGAGWGQYYFGVIGYKIAEIADDIYSKTGLFRATFAAIGLIGLLLIAFFISRFFSDKFTKYAFWSLFLLLEITSVSLVLLMREVRYYSLVIFLTCLIVGLYASFRFHKPFNKTLFVLVESLGLWLLFNTFSPVYFITISSILASESIIAISQYSKSGSITSVAKESLPALFSLIISFAGVFPLLFFYKTFEISKAMAEYNGYSSEMYWNNLSTIYGYFMNFELLSLAFVMKLLSAFNLKKLLKEGASIFKVSNFLTLYFIVSSLAIAKIPNFIYTRYIIFLQPLLTIIVILDFFLILKIYSRASTKALNPKIFLATSAFVGVLFFVLLNNMDYMKGHVYEMNHQYKGPLDYTIPYIQETFSKTDTLVLAANYEEASYMYYLNCKVLVGYVGNNLVEDSKANPHIVVYRKSWGNFLDTFNGYFQRAAFKEVSFPIHDNPTNNIPELNFKPPFNHQFKTMLANSQENATYLYVRE